MKTLIVFYSLTGHAKGLAEAIAAGAVGEILEIKTAKRLPKNWFMKLFVGGHQAMKKETPALLPYDLNPQAYDMIFLGTPVWASTFAPAVRSFLALTKLQNKKIALFCSHGGESAGQTFANLEKELAGNEIAGKIDFKMDGISAEQTDKNLEEAKAWARKLMQG